MPEMDLWEWVLLGGAGYLALIALVRLMRRRRDAILDELSWQAEIESRRKSLEQNRQEQKKLMEKFNRKAG